MTTFCGFFVVWNISFDKSRSFKGLRLLLFLDYREEKERSSVSH